MANHADRLSRFDGELTAASEYARDPEPAISPLANPAVRDAVMAERSAAWGDSPETVAARGGADRQAPLGAAVAGHVRSQTGVDVSGATVHSGPAAADRAAAHDTRSVTIGSDIFLGAGAGGDHLLAHEATHVAQQATDPSLAGTPQCYGVAAVAEVGEKEAHEVAGGMSSKAPEVTPAKVSDGPGYALSQTQILIQQTSAFIETTESTLVPAFRSAIDALDPAGALQLAQAAVKGLDAAIRGLENAKQRGQDANPYARTVCEPGQEATDMPVEAWEVEEHDALLKKLSALATNVGVLERRMLIDMSPQVFRDQAVLGSYQMPPGAKGQALETVIRESSTTIDLVITVVHVRELLGLVPPFADPAKKKEAASKVEAWKGRPANFRFLYRVLSDEGLWGSLAHIEGASGRSLGKTQAAVVDQARETGNFADVGEFDAARVDDVLSRGFTDWAISDEDAEKVFKMIGTAAPAVRGKLVLQLDEMGKLGRLCENLPWRWVQELHDVVDDPEAKAKLRPHFQGKGGGESMTKVYERQIMENIEEDQLARAYLWTLLDTAHSGLTFGFKDVHDSAYDANQEGWISDDAYLSTTAKGLGRAAALMAATMVTGGAAGAWGEGAALGLGAGKTTAQLVGGAVGGAASGVGGQLTADVFDQMLMGKEGFSSAGDYGNAALMGGATGALTAGVQAAGSKFLPASAKSMSQTYAERFPKLDNTLTRMRNAGIRDGLVMRVTAQELNMLVKSGLTTSGGLQQSLDRIGMVYSNERIDVNSRNMSKIHPQSEIERFYGDVDPATGQVNVRNRDPSSGGYVADADSIPVGSKATDQSMRDVLGVDGPANFYDKYKNPADPLFEVTFKVGAELDVPLPQTESPGTPLGSMHPDTHHMAGAGATKGAVPEGKLPMGAPIEIVDIQPVGGARGSYPSTGATYGPYSPAVPSVRNVGAPVAGATSGGTQSGYYDDEEDVCR